MIDKPWEHPDWYDLHDTTWTAGPEREPEHYREMMLALPPLDARDHLIDVGAGTGKLAAIIAASYPRLGRLTLVEPNEDKLERARLRLEKILPSADIRALAFGLGENSALPKFEATIVSIGSVLMPMMELGGGTLDDGLRWLRASLADVKRMLKPSAWVYAIETLAAPWARGSLSDPVRRLNMLELADEFERAGFQAIECVYRFRDRIVLRGRSAER